jgi:hypothetical protein
MIVSSGLAMTSLPRRKRGPVKAVQYSVPGNDVVSAVPPQKKNFNISKNIAKPLIFDPKDPKCKMGFVPLKSEQLFSHAEGAMLFNGPEPLILEKLDVPSNDFYKALSFDAVEDVDVPFTEGLAYKMGIRPSAGPRLLKAQPAPAEPTAPYPTRPTNPFVKRTTRLKTYSLGKLDLEALGR